MARGRPQHRHQGGLMRLMRCQHLPHSGSRRPSPSSSRQTGQSGGKIRSRAVMTQGRHGARPFPPDAGIETAPPIVEAPPLQVTSACGGARSGARVVARRDPRATLGSDRRDLLRSQTLRRAPAFMDDVHFLLAVDRLEPPARGCARLTRLEGGAPARTIFPMTANRAAEVAHEHTDQGDGDAGQEGAHDEAGEGDLPAAVARERDADTRGVLGGEVRDEDAEAECDEDAETRGHGESEFGGLARGRALFFLDRPLTLDAVAGERQRFETLLRDGFPAPLAVAEIAFLELLKGGTYFLEQTSITVAELEEELPVIRSGRLIAEVLGGIIFGSLGVGYSFPDSFHELAVFLFQLLPELSESLLPHRCLLRDTAGSGPESGAKATMRPKGNQSRGAAQRSTESSGASPHSRSSA